MIGVPLTSLKVSIRPFTGRYLCKYLSHLQKTTTTEEHLRCRQSTSPVHVDLEVGSQANNGNHDLARFLTLVLDVPRELCIMSVINMC